MAQHARQTIMYSGRQYQLDLPGTIQQYQNRANNQALNLNIQQVFAIPASATAPRAMFHPDEVWFSGSLYMLDNTTPHNQFTALVRTSIARPTANNPPTTGQEAAAADPSMNTQPQEPPASPEPMPPGRYPFPTVSTIPIPARAVPADTRTLPMQFDLAANLRSVPPPPAPPRDGIPDGRNNRVYYGPWDPAQLAYLDQLLWLAMLDMGRWVERRDFPAIVEALNRHFLGTPNHVNRGWNSVHSFVTRRPGWEEFVDRVLP